MQGTFSRVALIIWEKICRCSGYGKHYPWTNEASKHRFCQRALNTWALKLCIERSSSQMSSRCRELQNSDASDKFPYWGDVTESAHVMSFSRNKPKHINTCQTCSVLAASCCQEAQIPSSRQICLTENYKESPVFAVQSSN